MTAQNPNGTIRGPEPPFIGAVYVNRRGRGRWRWEVVGRERVGDLWRLRRMGRHKRTIHGDLLRTTAELRDRRKWRMIGVTTASVDTPSEQLTLTEGK